MTSSKRSQSRSRQGAKSLLSTLKMTTAIGAVGLTLAGWGALAQAEAATAAQLSQGVPDTFTKPVIAGSVSVASLAGTAENGIELARPKNVTAPTETPIAAPTGTISVVAVQHTKVDAADAQIKLDVVQWVKSTAGDSVAVVRDDRGVLWYVWGSDVPLIEQGLSPQISPRLVNSRGRSRHS